MNFQTVLRKFNEKSLLKSFIFFPSYLLCGDILSAEKTFKIYEPKTTADNVHKMIDKGLVAVAQNDYEEALKSFGKAHEMDKDNILVSFDYIKTDLLY